MKLIWDTKGHGVGRLKYNQDGVRMCCVIGLCGMIILIRVLLVVCKIRCEDSDGTMKHRGWFEGGREYVYTEWSFGVGGFPFLLSLLIVIYSKAIDDFGKTTLELLACLVLFLDMNFEFLLCDINTIYLQPRPLRTAQQLGRQREDIDAAIHNIKESQDANKQDFGQAANLQAEDIQNADVALVHQTKIVQCHGATLDSRRRGPYHITGSADALGTN